MDTTRQCSRVMTTLIIRSNCSQIVEKEGKSQKSKHFFHSKLADFGPAACSFTDIANNYARFPLSFTDNMEIQTTTWNVLVCSEGISQIKIKQNQNMILVRQKCLQSLILFPSLMKLIYDADISDIVINQEKLTTQN